MPPKSHTSGVLNSGLTEVRASRRGSKNNLKFRLRPSMRAAEGFVYLWGRNSPWRQEENHGSSRNTWVHSDRLSFEENRLKNPTIKFRTMVQFQHFQREWVLLRLDVRFGEQREYRIRKVRRWRNDRASSGPVTVAHARRSRIDRWEVF